LGIFLEFISSISSMKKDGMEILLQTISVSIVLFEVRERFRENPRAK
jgi:hypothetical protein